MSNRAGLYMRSKRRVLASVLMCASAAVALAGTDNRPAPAGLSATQIADKHLAARGGLQAWRAVQALSVSGKLDAGSGDSVARSNAIARRGPGASARPASPAQASAGADKAAGKEAQQVQLPFRLEMKRPRKSRLEIDFAGKTAVQVYDGQHGWKLRPFLNRDEVEPFTEDEAKAEAAKAELDGPLVDYTAKGTQVALEGTEAVDGHNAYKLKLTEKNGDVRHIWIDAQSFLDVKVEGAPRRMDGKMHKVFVYQRDFRNVKGLMMPFLNVTSVEGYPQTHSMVIESVNVNPTLDDSRFAKPQVLVAGSAPAAAPAKPAPVKK